MALGYLTNFERGQDKGRSQEIPKTESGQTTNVNQLHLRGFRTRALGTLFHKNKMNNYLMSINGFEPLQSVPSLLKGLIR